MLDTRATAPVRRRRRAPGSAATGARWEAVCDASWSPSTGIATWAWQGPGDEVSVRAGTAASSYHAELLGVVAALRAAPAGAHVLVRCDCQAVVANVNRFAATGCHARRYARVWRLVRRELARLEVVHVEWVRGHRAGTLNRAVDLAARAKLRSLVAARE